MTQTLKKNKKTLQKKFQGKSLTNFVKRKKNFFFQNKIKSWKTKRFLARNTKSYYLFLKLIQAINGELENKLLVKSNSLRFPTQVFFENMPLIFKNKLNLNIEKNQTYRKNLSKKIHNRQKELQRLRREKKSKLSPLFYQPWKNIKLAPTKKQQWLNSAYTRYKYLRLKDRFDFFRGYLGQIILLTELHSTEDYQASWFAKYYFLWKNRHLKQENNLELFRQLQKTYQSTALSQQKLQSKIMRLQKQSWWYENLVQKKKLPKSIKKFILDRPNTAFRIHWKQQKREPWKNALLFKRAVYSGFSEDLRKENKFNLLKMKPYLRRKNPRYEKRNRVYHKWTILLANRRQKFRIKADKLARIKQITGKILFPFYGNLLSHQRKHLFKKSRVIKSKSLSSNEFMLSHLESRLDVVVYRLNLAPTILWARRLILDGSVFVSPQNFHRSESKWISMYSFLKAFAFPLKLRDPKNLYAATLLKDLPHHWGTFKFVDRPQTNIAYLLQPGDLIQCSLDNSLNKFKTTSFLWQKPLPAHLLTPKKKTFIWDWFAQKYLNKNFLNWKETSEKVNAAIFLNTPRFTDLPSTDRVKESFFRWASF